jgi:anti-sigma factor RsiW
MRLLRRRRPLTCREMVELVSSYIEGTLDRRDAKRFEEHLRPCDACSEYVQQLRTTVRITGSLNHTDLPAEMRERLLDAFRDWRERPDGDRV